MSEYRTRLKELLQELFQFDSADLDFGIYRIMNYKRAEIETFIDERLLDAVQSGLDRQSEAQGDQAKERLEASRAALIQTIGDTALDAEGNVTEQFKQLKMPVVTAYEQAKEDYETSLISAETEAQVYNDLYHFFARYYDDGDFISQRRFGRTKYAIPYNGEEVYLHWANADQYYIKSGEYFSNYTFTLSATSAANAAKVVFFKLHKAEIDRDNTKNGDKRFFILYANDPVTWDEASRELAINFEYRGMTTDEKSRLGTKDQQTKLNAEAEITLRDTLPDLTLKAQLLEPEPGDLSDNPPSRLARHLKRFSARHTRDFFIHKDLAGFLEQELDYYLKNEILRLDDIDLTRPIRARLALARVETIRSIARAIIAFLSQIENFQKRLFEKRKFILQSDYCLTLDRIPEAVRSDLLPRILANEAQLDAWRDLYSLDETTTPDLFNPTGDAPINGAFLAQNPHLMIDTALFDADFKQTLLAAFEDLDATLDGLLVHGENFQALNLLMPRYREQVKSIYVDPPYNTIATEILYKNEYKHSSWLSLIYNRVQIARELLTSTGLLCVTIDDYELNKLKFILDDIFLNENYLATVPIRNNPSGRSTVKGFAINHGHGSKGV